MILFLYKIVTGIVYLVIYPFVSKKAKNGDQLWQGRLGEIDSKKADIWIHASSVGEVKVINHIVKFLKENNPAIKVHISTFTQNGFNTAIKDFGDDVTISFFPLDSSQAVNKTFNKIKPKVIVIAETEIWFNFLRIALKKNIPVVLINGRMSEKAFGRYKLLKSSLKKILPFYARMFVKSKVDADRYIRCGADPSKVFIAGDMKFDAPILNRSEGRIREIRNRAGLSDDDFILVAGSTRPGEEILLVCLLQKMQGKYKNFKLILAPRHIERCEQLSHELTQGEIKLKIYGSVNQSEDIVMVNQIGILNDLYLASDLAFVGGTLVDKGGHNILEPVWAGTPVIYGPYIANVKESSEYILEHNFGRQINSKDDLFSVVESVYLKQLKLNIKTETDEKGSPTSNAGEYILKIIKNV